LEVFMIRLNIPYRSQWAADADLHSGDCGPTCLSMLLNYYGIDMTPNGVYKIRQPKKRYWAIGELISAAQAKKITLEYERYADKQDALRNLYANLDGGRPVIALVKYQPWRQKTGNLFDFGHYVVVTGYENGRITVNDPIFGHWKKPGSLGAHYAYSEDEFCKGWGGFDWQENPNWACIVVKDSGGRMPLEPETAVIPSAIPERPPTPQPQPGAVGTPQLPASPSTEAAATAEPPPPLPKIPAAQPERPPKPQPPPISTPQPPPPAELAEKPEPPPPVKPEPPEILLPQEKPGPQPEPQPEPEPEPVAVVEPAPEETEPNRMDDINKRVRALAAFRWAVAPDPNNKEEMQLWLDHLGDWGLYYDEYIVRPGDSLTLLAGRFYGDQRRWHGIEEYNDFVDRRLWVGIKLLIPKVGEEGTYDSPALPKNTAPYTKDLDMIIRSEAEAEDYNELFGSETFGIGFME
jgi:nucleoid-associated protein YgaU